MSLQFITDKQLIDSYLSGSHSSIEILINRYKLKVYSYITILVNDKHLADDIFQDTFLLVINGLHAGIYSDDDKFLSWVLRIAHNKTLDHFRKVKSTPIFIPNKEGEDLLDRLLIPEHSIEDALDMILIKKNVETLLEYLPYEQKEVIVMRHFHNMSYKEIAKKIKINNSTIRSYMHRGLLNLRKINQEKHLFSHTNFRASIK